MRLPRIDYHGKYPLVMDQPKALSTAVLLHISQQIAVPLKSLVSTIALFDEGATVPFIARYRKEVTGNLDEVQIRAIEEKLRLLPRTGRARAKPSCTPSRSRAS